MNSTAVPIVYALCQKKDQLTYEEIFKQIKTNDPKRIMTDFEIANTNAIQKAFPSTIRHGCYFHFCQAVYRNIQSNGLANEFLRNEEFRKSAKMLMALAFMKVKFEYIFLTFCCFFLYFLKFITNISFLFHFTLAGTCTRSIRVNDK